MSAVLFSLAMNILAKAAEVECRSPLSKSGVGQPPIRAYMEDLTVTTTSVTGARWILKGLEGNIKWDRMKFKPAKSRFLVLRRGKVSERILFKLAGEPITSVNEKLVRSLCKIFDSSLKDTALIQQTIRNIRKWLNKIDKLGLPGRFKTQVFQHAVFPRILWPSNVYEFPLITGETLERTISSQLRRWLGVLKCLSSAAYYGKNNTLKLPFRSLIEEYKVLRIRERLQFREGIQTRSGRKRRVEYELRVVEERIRHKNVLGSISRGRAELVYFPSPQISKAMNKERRQIIQDGV